SQSWQQEEAGKDSAEDGAAEVVCVQTSDRRRLKRLCSNEHRCQHRQCHSHQRGGDKQRCSGEYEAPQTKKIEVRMEVLPDQRVHVVHQAEQPDRKSTRLNSSHVEISYAVFCLKKKKNKYKEKSMRSRS